MKLPTRNVEGFKTTRVFENINQVKYCGNCLHVGNL